MKLGLIYVDALQRLFDGGGLMGIGPGRRIHVGAQQSGIGFRGSLWAGDVDARCIIFGRNEAMLLQKQNKTAHWIGARDQLARRPVKEFLHLPIQEHSECLKFAF